MIYKLKVNGLNTEKKKYVEVVAPDRETLGHYFWDVVRYELYSDDFVPASFEVFDISDNDAVDFVIEEELPKNFVPDVSVLGFEKAEDMFEYLADLPVSSEVEEAIERIVG